MNLDDIMKQLARGKADHAIIYGSATGSTTSAVAASGFFTAQIYGQSIGSTWPGTIVGYNENTFSGNLMSLNTIHSGGATARGMGLARFYKIGTLDLAATGNRFTHDAATFPLLRTVMGAASTPIKLIPVLQITTGTTTTPAVIRMRTAAGGAGYVDQAGNNVVGARTITMPAAATTAGSCFIMRLEPGDYAVRDITNIEVTTAAAAGAATLWGMELISCSQNVTLSPTDYNNILGAEFSPMALKPAAATSGTVSSFLGGINISGATITHRGFNIGVYEP